MTGLGPSIRRLPSGDPKATPGGALGVADGKPEGGSDAGDSLDGQLSGELTGVWDQSAQQRDILLEVGGLIIGAGLSVVSSMFVTLLSYFTVRGPNRVSRQNTTLSTGCSRH